MAVVQIDFINLHDCHANTNYIGGSLAARRW